MVHDPVEQGDDKCNSFLSSMFILRADPSGTEMLILLLYFNSSSIGLRTVTHWNTSCSTIKYVDVYGDSLVLLVQRSNFQTRKRLEAGADLFKYWCHRPWTFKVYSIK